jgi:hypothetical protein
VVVLAEAILGTELAFFYPPCTFIRLSLQLLKLAE